MMPQRYIPYGYRIRDGRLCVNKDEADADQTVFRLYREGASYKTIARRMDAGGHPPRSDNGWNMHHIKRMLEDGRYTGGNGYPAILTAEQYGAARAAHDGKFIPNAPKGTPADVLWARLRCGECGARLIRHGRVSAKTGLVRFYCGCGFKAALTLAELHGIVATLLGRLADEVRVRPSGEYAQTPEALRLSNEIARCTAKLDDPDKAAGLILAGVSARYAGIVEPPRLPLHIQYGDEYRPMQTDWNLFSGAVSQLSLSRNGAGITTNTGYTIFMEVDTKCREP